MSSDYTEALAAAIEGAQVLGLEIPPAIQVEPPVVDAELARLADVCNNTIWVPLKKARPGSWAELSRELAVECYAYLAAFGWQVDIVIGDIAIGGRVEYGTKASALARQYRAGRGTRFQHMWLSIGGDSVVDPVLPDWLATHRTVPREQLPTMLIGRAGEIEQALTVQYLPLLVGADFVSKTTGVDPYAQAGKLRASLRRLGFPNL